MEDSAHVVLQTIRHTPLDEFSIIVYLCVFYVLGMTTFRRPIFGLAGLILIEPFALYRDVGATTFTLPKIAIAAVAVGLLLRRPPLRDLLRKPALSIVISALAIVAATALSYLQAEFKTPVVRETLKAMEYLLVFALAFLCYRIDPDETIVRRVLFFIAAIVSLLAISQEFTSAPAGIWIGHHAVPRIAGPLEGPNQLSGYLGLILPLLFAFSLTRASWFEWAVVGITLAAELLTFSRTGVATSLIAVFVVLVVLRVRSVKLYTLGLALPIFLGAAAVVLIGGEVSHFWSTAPQFQPSGLGTRAQLWEAAYRLWLRHPLLGVGAGNYELELGSAGFPGIHTHSNSGYIQALVEGGFPLLISVVVVTYFSIASFARNPNGSAIITGAFGASVGIALHELLDYLMFYPKVGVLYWVILGIGCACLTQVNIKDGLPLDRADKSTDFPRIPGPEPASR